MIDIEAFPIKRVNRLRRILVVQNKIKSIAISKSLEIKKHPDEYIRIMKFDYACLFPQQNNMRINRILNNSTQPDIEELLFFSNYIGLPIEKLIEGPTWN